MDTVLNLGLNDDTVEGLIKQSGNSRFAYDCYRRFVQMYDDYFLKTEFKPNRILLKRFLKKRKSQGVSNSILN